MQIISESIWHENVRIVCGLEVPMLRESGKRKIIGKTFTKVV